MTVRKKMLTLNQEEFITWVLDNTFESSVFRVHPGTNYIIVGIDKIDIGAVAIDGDLT